MAGAASVVAAAPIPAVARKWRLFMRFSPFERSVTEDGRQAQPLFARAVERNFITRIRMAHDTGGGIVPKYPLDPLCCRIGAIATDHHARVLREAHADTAAVMQADPSRPAGAIEKCVQQWPVRDGVGAVLHRLGL